MVASLHFPQLNGIGTPTSSISNLIGLIKFNLSINFLNFSIPKDCPILTDPIFPERIKICSAERSEGIFSSYSLIVFFPHLIFFLNY